MCPKRLLDVLVTKVTTRKLVLEGLGEGGLFLMTNGAHAMVLRCFLMD